MAKSPDPRQPSFSFDAAPVPRPGSMQFGAELRSALARAIKECPKSRAVVAAEMTDLVFGDGAGEGNQVTVAMLDSWTAPSREAWRFPLEFFPAFVAATAAHWLLDLVAGKCGCRILIGDEAALADLAALRVRGEETRRAENELRKRIDPSAAERLLKRTGGGRS